MITHLRLPAVAITVVATLLLGAGDALAASHPVPFTATFSGSAAITGPTTTAFTGTGIATLMGSIANDGHVDITGFDDSCSGGIANVHVETLTAANGDTLTISSQDVACPTGPGRYDGTGRWTVIGGTGRFGAATGQGSFGGSSDFVAGSFRITLTGLLVLSR